MVNNRLVWFLERNKLITPLQCGFREQRSTTDHLVRLESFIREAFIQRQHAVAVFFDLKKAYDCTWKYGIMKDVHQAGLPCFIEGVLKNRQFSVRLSACPSGMLDQEMGVPQGSVLSSDTLCFKNKLNSQSNFSWRRMFALCG